MYQLDPKNPVFQYYYAMTNAYNQKFEEASYWMAVCYALLNEIDISMDWLEIAVDRGFINYRFFNKHDPFLGNIRKEPRFKQLLDRVKYEAENFEV